MISGGYAHPGLGIYNVYTVLGAFLAQKKVFSIETFKGITMTEILNPNKPPKHLTKEAKKIWRQLCKEWEFEPDQLLILRVGLEAFDRLQEARLVLNTEGLTITSITGKGVARKSKHPALEAEKTSRAGFLQAMRMLGLDISSPGQIGRPGGSGKES